MKDTASVPTLEAIRQAASTLEGIVVRTPLVRLEGDFEGREIWLKLENLQPINAFKIRGAVNAIAELDENRRAQGVWTISAGNAGQGVAWAARRYGIPCTVVVIETAPDTKVRRMEQLGAELVRAPFDECWQAMQDRRFPGVEGAFIHPFDDDAFITGNATIGLEILDDLPEVDVVCGAIGGGGLMAGVGAAIRPLRSDVTILGAEPETAAPLALSFERGSPQVFDRWEKSFVDGAGGKSVFPSMWDRLHPVLDGSVVVSLEEVREAIRTIAERARVISEGAGALPVAAAIAGRTGGRKIVAIVSGGNIDLRDLAGILTGSAR
ncbi:MAG: pyridoxal-phosphate dependent enzyme [Acidobacteria bacterium]|nr:pyridoxal-phosphate dependent enzyme [Acidobacteriota bacterium]